MSNSYKKQPYCGPKSKYMKEYARRKFRRTSDPEELYPGNSYRKFTNPWDICDYCYMYQDFEQYYQEYMQMYLYWESIGILKENDRAPSRKELMRQWYRDYKGK